MEKLILKQNSLSLSYGFQGLDTRQKILYTVKGGMISPLIDRIFGGLCGIPYSVKIQRDADGKTFTLKKKFSFLFENYLLLNEQGELFAEIQRAKKMVKAEIRVISIEGEFLIETDLMARTFQISQDGLVVARVKKVLLGLRDSYELSYDDTLEPSLFIAIVVSLDNMFHN